MESLAGRCSFARHVAETIPFITSDIGGEDKVFTRECIRRNLRFVESDPFNYCLVRHRELRRHTWLPSNEVLNTHSEKVCKGLRLDIIHA